MVRTTRAGDVLHRNLGSYSTRPRTCIPGGADTNVQYNDAGEFGGDSNLVWFKLLKRFGIGTSTVPHGGVGNAKVAVEGNDDSFQNGPHTQFTTDADNYPLLSITPKTHDDIAVGFDCYPYESNPAIGSFWVERTNTAAENLYGVAYGNGVWIAVGYLAGTAVILRSTDNGVNWSSIAVPVGAVNLRHVAYGNGVFCIAVADALGEILRSTDYGATWSSVFTGTNPLYTVCYGASNTWCALGNYTGTRVYTVASTDNGATWTAATAGSDDYACYGIAYGNGVFVGVGYAAGGGLHGHIRTASLATVQAGGAWTTRTCPVSGGLALHGIQYSPTLSMWVANGEYPAGATQGTVIKSIDNGASWTTVSGIPVYNLWGVCWAGDRFVIVGGAKTSYDAYCATSTDGNTWTEYETNPTLPSEDLYFCEYNNTDGVVVSVGSPGTGPVDSFIITSTQEDRWKSGDAGSNFIIFKRGDVLEVRCAAGTAVGTDVVWTTVLSIDNAGNVELPALEASHLVATDANNHLVTVDQTFVDHNSITNTHDLTTDIDHDAITNAHNLTTDIDHDALTNAHNLTTDIDHGSINGLGDDDHTGYVKADGTRAMTYLQLTPGSAPGSPAEGMIYADSATHKLMFYDGTGWVDLTV